MGIFGKKNRSRDETAGTGPSDWSDIERVRAEWPNTGFDEAADRRAWEAGLRAYDAASPDEYGAMLRSAEQMTQALRHNLYGPGLIHGSDLVATVGQVLFAATTAPPGGRDFADAAARYVRLALTVAKMHGWQTQSLGGDGTLGELFQGGRYMLFSSAIGPNNAMPGDLGGFFRNNATGPIGGAAVPEPPSPGQAAIAEMESVIADARSGDVASQLRQQGFAAQMNGDNESALEFLEQAARLGDTGSMYDAGCVAMELGRTSAAVQWWELAAGGGHGSAMMNLGAQAIRSGDAQTASRWWQRAAEAGERDGYGALTQLADDAGDAAGELHWSRLGADLGQPFCMLRHGQLLLQQAGQDPSGIRQALRYLEPAASAGDPDAMFVAGLAYGQMGDTGSARGWLVRADQSGHPRAAAVMQKYGL